MTNQLKFRDDIQILRGLAVLVVVLFHLEVPFLRNGFLGVDVFFVISGYLMARLYDQGSVLDFFSRRMKRLLPAYFVLIGCTALATSLIALPVDFKQLFEQSLIASVFSSNIGYWAQNSYFNKAEFNPLLNLWSLGVEIQYYMIVPLLLPLVRRYKALFALAFLGSLACAFVMVTISAKTAFFWLPFRVWEFLLGAGAAWWFFGADKAALKPFGFVPSAVLMAGLLVALILPLAPEDTSMIYGHPGLAALYVSVISALILSKELSPHFSCANIFGKAFFYLGRYSYSIYLVHFPVIVLYNYEPFGGMVLGVSSVLDLAAMLAIIVVASALLYAGFERMRGGHGFWRKMLAIILICGAFIYGSKHINEAQYSEAQQKIFYAWEDRAVYRCGKLARILNPFSNICLIGEDHGERDVLLIGNSHADSIKMAVHDVLSAHGINTHFYVPNNPVMGAPVTHEIVLRDVKERGIEAVLLHYAPGVYNSKSHRQNLRTMIKNLHAENIPVFVLSPVPTYEFHVPKKLYEATIDRTVAVEGLPLHQYKKQNAEFDKMVQEKIFRDEAILDLSPYLCPENRCIIEKDGAPIYFDGGHLTLTGGRLIEPLIEKMAGQVP